MCSWEQTQFACGHYGKLKKQKYSCAIYTRFIYGECLFDKRRSRVTSIISFEDCKDCQDIFEFVNL